MNPRIANALRTITQYKQELDERIAQIDANKSEVRNYEEFRQSLINQQNQLTNLYTQAAALNAKKPLDVADIQPVINSLNAFIESIGFYKQINKGNRIENSDDLHILHYGIKELVDLAADIQKENIDKQILTCGDVMREAIKASNMVLSDKEKKK